MAREQYGLEINQGPFEIDSRLVHIAAKYAEAQDKAKGETFHKAVMDAYWHQARSIDDPVVLKELAESVGLNGEDFAAALQNPEFEQQVLADVQTARDYRLDGVPALIFADTYLVSGAQPYDVLKRVVEKVQEEQ